MLPCIIGSSGTHSMQYEQQSKVSCPNEKTQQASQNKGMLKLLFGLF